MADQITIPTELLRSLVDEDDCWFDHHGGCQAHSFLSLEPGQMCPQQEAKELLARGAIGIGSTALVSRELIYRSVDHAILYMTGERDEIGFKDYDHDDIAEAATQSVALVLGLHDPLSRATGPPLACTCPLGPEDAHLSDCPMWVAPAVDRG